MRNNQLLSSLREITFNVLRAADEAIGQLHFDISHDYKDSIILAGSERGGTTWVSELVNYDNSYRLIFEPISHHRGSDGKPFLWGRYIRTDDDDPSFLDPVRKIVCGLVRTGYSDRFNRHLFPRKRLIKEVGVNLLLHWLHSHFPEIPIILLVRHPCATINSRRRIGWALRNVDGFLRQERLMSDLLSPFRSAMENASPFEAQVMRCCIEIFVPLRLFKPGEIHVAFYEKFRVQPRREVERLFAFLGKPLDERIFARMKQPSKRTRLRKSRELPPTSSFDNWRHQFSEQELRSAQDVLRLFRLDSLYRADGVPDEQVGLTLLNS